MAGLMWCGVGVMLIRYAVSWLALCTAKEDLFFYSAGFLVSMPIHHFGFLKIADKNLNRLLPLKEKTESFFLYGSQKLSDSYYNDFNGHRPETFTDT